jgi:hypothetical protein
MEDFYDFVDEVGEEEEVPNMSQQRLPKRYIRNVFDPFEYYHNDEFEKRYRFSKVVVVEIIIPLVIRNLEKPTNRGLPVPPLLQLLIALKFCATGNFQV